MDNPKDITVLSLCTGYGGLELGLHRAVRRPLRVVAVEIEAFAEANLVAKAEEGKLAIEAMYPDVKTFPAAEFSGCFDFILAGYPCQPFSVAGKQAGAADPRHLWPFIKDHIQQIRPVWCLFENVAGHLSLGFDIVEADLDGLGYTVEAGIFSAAEVGAPHRRERLFVLAHRDGDGRCGILREAGRRQGRAQQRANPAGQSAGNAGSRAPCQLAYAKRAEPGMRITGIEGPPGCGRDRSAIDGCRLGNSDGQSRRIHTEGRDGEAETRSAGRELGNPRSDVLGGFAGSVSSPTGKGVGKTGESRQIGDNAGNTSQLANCNGSGCEQQCRAQSVRPEQSAVEYGGDGGGRWPARPGEPQYDWEEPRTVESGMGRTVDGFRSRVDELRLLGNGVVPAQAELAFRTLWEKMKLTQLSL